MKNRRKVKKFYDLLAELYDELYSEEQSKKHEVVLRTLPNKEGLLLDLGCGTGELSLKIRESGWPVIAADISLNMLKVAKRKGVVHLVQCSFDNPPFRPKSFDFIAAITVFSDYFELRSAMDKLKELVRPAGLIIASIPRKGIEGRKLAEFKGVNDAFLFLRL